MHKESITLPKLIREVVKVVLGLQKSLNVDDLSRHCKFEFLNSNIDISILALEQAQPKYFLTNNNDVFTIRDLLQNCFALLGIEIEYCGKGEFEKAVIIDYDISVLDELCISLDSIKFGQTVIKTEVSVFELPKDLLLVDVLLDAEVRISDFDLNPWLGKVIMDELCVLRENSTD